ncbi:MAG TPA: hypothetical protein ACYCC3_00325 [Candidatus Azoamicus sp.]
MFKKNKKYSNYVNKKIFPCLISNSNTSINLIFKHIKINNTKLIAVKSILQIIKNKKLKIKKFTENKFSNFNTMLDLFVCK